jgi:arginine exporter protein ArgO
MKEAKNLLDFIFDISVILITIAGITLGLNMISEANTLINFAGVIIIMICLYTSYSFIVKSLINKNKKEKKDEK